jgi:methyl-accepting chemotaxis protein
MKLPTAFARSVQNLIDLKDEMAAFMVNDAQIAQITGMSDLLDGYGAGFEQVYALQTQRNELVPVLNGTGRDARSTLSEIIDSAYNDGDIEAAYYGGIVQQHLMLARYYGEKFLLANESDDRDRTLQEIATAQQNFATLERNLQNPGAVRSRRSSKSKWPSLPNNSTRSSH